MKDDHPWSPPTSFREEDPFGDDTKGSGTATDAALWWAAALILGALLNALAVYGFLKLLGWL